MTKTEDDLPDSFFCPLTYQLMIDPVMDTEGNTYERSAIEDWLNRNPTSPISRSPLQIKDLLPNRALKEAIEKMRQETGIDNIKRVPAVAANIAQPVQSNNDISLTLTSSPGNSSNSLKVLASLKPSSGTNRTPVNVCCVVDVSGSMSTIATFKNETGKTESHGLTILDIVKHAVSTIIHTLNENDRLSIVAYSTSANVVTELTTMDDAGKKLSEEKLKTLKPLASTNLWDGLHKGMEVLRNSGDTSRLNTVFILTDGMPNIEPPRGHIPMLKRYQDQHKLNCTISSFGFGYTMDSKLLNDIALEGNGMYAFIPDSGFVGTTFVNSISNVLVTCAKDVKLDIMNGDNYTIKEPKNCPSWFTPTSWGASVSLSTLHFGQTRDFVFEVESNGSTTKGDESIVSVTGTYLSVIDGSSGRIEKELDFAGTSPLVDIERNYFRQGLVEVIDNTFLESNLSKKSSIVDEFLSLIEKSEFSSDDFIKDLCTDVNGQVKEAVSKSEYFNKWGKHYLPSLARAHSLQQCNNFKDPGIQHYGGTLFNEIRDKGDDIFISLPAPTPTGNTNSYSYGSNSSTTFSSYTYKPVSMSSYYSSSNPCFSGKSLVSLANGMKQPCSQIKKGDYVLTGTNKIAQVLCVVKTYCKDGYEDLVLFKDGLEITPYHPIRMENKWYFPCDLQTPVNTKCDAVYSFVLDCHHSMIINDIECVTLGHDFKEDVVAHPYFGSQLVINDLKKLPGWDNGLIEFNSGCVVKSSITDLICGFNIQKIIPANNMSQQVY